MKIGILGGGAAGFFAAIHCRLFNNDVEVTVIEKSQKTLSKVKISGGGRCNVTNIESDPIKLSTFYPRGEKLLAKAFREFNTKHTIQFFEERGVALVSQSDGCVFPKSQDSQSIIDCFFSQCKQLNIPIFLGVHANSISQDHTGKWIVASKEKSFVFDRLIICVGGMTNVQQMEWLKQLGQPMIAPVPSLFTFNMPDEWIKELMGVVAPNTATRIPGLKFVGKGPLLITHWGMSGPAILMLSAKAARELEEKKYNFSCLISWLGIINEAEVLDIVNSKQISHSRKKIGGSSFEGLPTRLWDYLLLKCNIDHEKPWSAINNKEKNKLVVVLTQDNYKVSGKTTHKEEFVTAGGVDLKQVNFMTMESRVLPNLFFAGEVLDIDGLTGGFNFQAAWTTAWLAARGATASK